MRPGVGWMVLGLVVAACGSGPVPTGPVVAGTTAAPREVNVIAYDYSYSPPVVDLVPGETVMLHVVDAGLATHEVVIGTDATQAAWEAAEAGASPAPPGQTPALSVAPDVAGLRVVVASGERRDVVFHVPHSSAALVLGCHVPGHWARGMQVPVRLVAPGASALGAGERNPG